MIGGSSSGGLQGDGVAESFELGDEAAGGAFGVAVGEVVAAGFAVELASGEHVPAGAEDRVSHMIAVCRLRHCKRTRAYATKRTADGLNSRHDLTVTRGWMKIGGCRSPNAVACSWCLCARQQSGVGALPGTPGWCREPVLQIRL